MASGPPPYRCGALLEWRLTHVLTCLLLNADRMELWAPECLFVFYIFLFALYIIYAFVLY